MKHPTLDDVERLRPMLSGKWKLVILYHLIDGAIRWSVLTEKLPQAAPNVLTRQLRQLERDGLIRRTVVAAHPPQVVEYSLTERGAALIPLLQQLAQWDARFRLGIAG